MELSKVQVGQKLTWLHQERGGWGYVTAVDAEVVSVGKKRVQIHVKRVSGETVIRSVDPANLRERKGAKA